MKFLIVTLIALFSFTASHATADDTKVSPVVLEKFHSSFESASEVKWVYTNNLYKASFAYSGQYINAFYDEAGNMIALTRNISAFQLPLTLQSSLKNDYKQYWISDLFELSDTTGTTYYVTIEKAEERIVLKSSGSYGWSTYQKQKK